MATQDPLNASSTAPASAEPRIRLPPGFHISPQDRRLKQPGAPVEAVDPPLGVLQSFVGTFAGQGLNLIFRPNSDKSIPSVTVLEINLTTETIAFSDSLGEVVNRGLGNQPDISLNGVPYVQTVNDVTNIATGKGDAKENKIHFEPGIWMHVPATTVDPVITGASLNRMASIPHGTTINAQSLEPTDTLPGPPPFTGSKPLPSVDITPFTIGVPSDKKRFPSQTAAAATSARLPPDLTNFINAGTITQDILDNPNLVLARAIQGQTINKTTVFTVATNPTAPFVAGGTANIDFLQGATVGAQTGPNASAVQMQATFWIEEVQHTLNVPVFRRGDKALEIRVPPSQPGGQSGPLFRFEPPEEVKAPRTITVTSTQIQYMQTVDLNFAGLIWPHVSCATLVPSQPLSVPASAFK